MKPILFLLMLSALISSCKGQDKTISTGPEIAMADRETASLIPGIDEMPEWSMDYSFFTWTSGIKPGKPIALVRQLTEDKDGNLWIASWNGIYRYNTSREHNPCNTNQCNHDRRYISQEIAHRLETEKLITRFSQFDSLKFFNVFCVFNDSKGNIWFGTRHHGVFRYDGTGFQQFDKTTGLCENFVNSIAEDNHGRMWFGTDNGLSMYDETSISEDHNGFTNFNKQNGLPHNVILSLKQDKIHNKLWIGTQAGLCFYDGKSLQSFSNNAGMPFLNAETLFIDSKNVLWIGHSEGITAYNGETFKSLTKKDGLPDNFVACMTETNPQNPVYWFGIRDSFGRGLGICRYDGISVSYLKHEDGLPNDRIINMITDDDGNIWMGTADGVIRFDGAKFRTIAQEDGC